MHDKPAIQHIRTIRGGVHRWGVVFCPGPRGCMVAEFDTEAEAALLASKMSTALMCWIQPEAMVPLVDSFAPSD
jgi:hypothetical protein